MSGPGRSNKDKLARMGRILLLLSAHPGGLTTDELVSRVGYPAANPASKKRVLNRDLAALREDGWRIDTGDTANTSALRKLRTVDTRFATAFTTRQREQLARAALCAGEEIANALSSDLGRASGPPAFQAAPYDGRKRLVECQIAVADRCVLRFDYNGKPRLVHPVRVLTRQGAWYLSAFDTQAGEVKTFRLERMHDLDRDEPGTAVVRSSTDSEPVWDFMRHRIHDPIEVSVTTSPEFLDEVTLALGRNGYRSEGIGDGQVRVRCVVTNQDALVARLLELGTRVRLEGPPEIRALLRDRLERLAG